MPNNLPKDPLEIKKVALYIQNYMEGFVIHENHERVFHSGSANNDFPVTATAIRKAVAYGADKKKSKPEEIFAYCFNQAGLQDSKPRENKHESSWLECLTDIVKSNAGNGLIASEKAAVNSVLVIIALCWDKNKEEATKKLYTAHKECQKKVKEGYPRRP